MISKILNLFYGHMQTHISLSRSSSGEAVSTCSLKPRKTQSTQVSTDPGMTGGTSLRSGWETKRSVFERSPSSSSPNLSLTWSNLQFLTQQETQMCVFVFVACRTLNMFGERRTLIASIQDIQISWWVRNNMDLLCEVTNSNWFVSWLDTKMLPF